ncbi:hypothetical protein RZS08_03435, partial [Arthrospira platensis SPKY1]|nr:hypothetical protein [Arthrospira platensis SPKY1]
VKYEAADWIQFTWRLGLDQYSSRLKSYWDNNSAEFGTGRLYQENVNNRLLNSDFLVSINKKLSNKWDFSAIVGHNYRYDLEVIDEFDGYEFVLPNFYDKSNIDRENIESLDDFIF